MAFFGIICGCAGEMAEGSQSGLEVFSNKSTKATRQSDSLSSFLVVDRLKETETVLTFSSDIQYLHVEFGFGGIAVDKQGTIGMFGWPRSEQKSQPLSLTSVRRVASFRLNQLLMHTSSDHFQAAVFASGHLLVSLPSRLRIYVFEVPDFRGKASLSSLRMARDSGGTGYEVVVKYRSKGESLVFSRKV